MYLYVSSKDSLDYFPQNSGGDFTVELPVALKGVCDLALTHVYGDSIRVGYYYVFCSVCTHNIVHGREDKILGSFLESGTLDTTYYTPVDQARIKRIRFTVLSAIDNTPYQGELYFTLHIRSRDG